MDCSSVHTTAQGPSSFPTSAVPSLHHRSNYAHHHPSTTQCLPPVHCHRTSTITHLSPLCFPGQKVHIRLLVGSRCLKYNPGFPLPQLRQVSACQPRTSRIPTVLLILPQQPYRIVLAAHNSKGYLFSFCVIHFPPTGSPQNLLQTSEGSHPTCFARYVLGILSAICFGLFSLPRWLDGFRAAPHPPFP